MPQLSTRTPALWQRALRTLFSSRCLSVGGLALLYILFDALALVWFLLVALAALAVKLVLRATANTTPGSAPARCHEWCSLACDLRLRRWLPNTEQTATRPALPVVDPRFFAPQKPGVPNVRPSGLHGAPLVVTEPPSAVSAEQRLASANYGIDEDGTDDDEGLTDDDDEMDETTAYELPRDLYGETSKSSKRPAYDLSYYERAKLEGQEISYRFSSENFTKLKKGEEPKLWWGALTVRSVVSTAGSQTIVKLVGEPSGMYKGEELLRRLEHDMWDWSPRAPNNDPKNLVGSSVALRNKDTGKWEEAYVISYDGSSHELEICYRYREQDWLQTINFLGSDDLVLRFLLTRDMDTTMDAEWEGQQLVGKTIQHYGGGAGRTTGSKVMKIEEKTNEDGQQVVWATDADGIDEIEVGKVAADGTLQYYGNRWDPEHAGADLIGRRIALCEYGQDDDGDGEMDQFQPAAWDKRPFVIAYDTTTEAHTVRYEDNTEEVVYLEPKGTSSWRYLQGW